MRRRACGTGGPRGAASAGAAGLAAGRTGGGTASAGVGGRPGDTASAGGAASASAAGLGAGRPGGAARAGRGRDLAGLCLAQGEFGVGDLALGGCHGVLQGGGVQGGQDLATLDTTS